MSNDGKTTPGKKHHCPVCQKSYAKAEHLLRHERIHTGSKPFSCADCKRSFSRQDSLLRHAKRHGHHPASASVSEQTSPPPIVPYDAYQSTSAQFSTSRVVPANVEGIDRSNIDNSLIFGPMETATTDESHFGMSSGDPALDPFMQLTWPDSEDLLQSILSADLAQLPQSLDVLYSQPMLQDSTALADENVSPWISVERSEEGHGGTHAVRNLSKMIANLSSDITAQAESTGLTTLFLDGCLHMFFANFVPSFPIVHRPTFVFRNWTHPLLLNAIAIGSLYVSQKDSLAKGEMLWRLAHTAVATSWHTLIKHRGEFDTSDGVQLVLTALFGQVYATLSRDLTLRKTAQIFHSLGFFWARECGMYEMTEFEPLQNLNLPEEQTVQKWRSWAARETQLRALLGHYILDGQLAQYTGSPTAQRHASSSLPLPCSDALFEAPTVGDWIAKMRLAPQQITTFREVFNSLFSTSLHTPCVTSSLSPLTIRVILEGLYSFVAELESSIRPAVGIPSAFDISCALGRLYLCISESPQLSPVDKAEILLRWHTISLDAVTDSGRLCQTICRHLNVEQRVFGGRKQEQPHYDIRKLVKSPQARRALLHAAAIRDILQEIPLGRAHTIHVPSSVFAAATVYSGFILSGTFSVWAPKVSDWEFVMAVDLDLPSVSTVQSFGEASQIAIKRYLMNGTDTSGIIPESRNLLYDFNLFPMHLKSLSQPWGISNSMQNILDQWSTHFEA